MTLADQAPRLRERIATTFGDTITIKRRASTGTDDEGNPSRTLTTVARIRGRISTPTAEQLQIAAQAGERVDAVLTAAVDADVRPGDVAECGSDTWKVETARASKVQLKANLSRWTG